MEVTLSPELECWIQENVANGRYPDASDLIGDALHLLRQQDADQQRKYQDLRAEIQKGIRAADRGEIVLGEEVFRKLRLRNEGFTHGRK